MEFGQQSGFGIEDIFTRGKGREFFFYGDKVLMHSRKLRINRRES